MEVRCEGDRPAASKMGCLGIRTRNTRDGSRWWGEATVDAGVSSMRRSGLCKKIYVVVYERKNGVEITVMLRITLAVYRAVEG